MKGRARDQVPDAPLKLRRDGTVEDGIGGGNDIFSCCSWFFLGAGGS
jgi:hypothetical protein